MYKSRWARGAILLGAAGLLVAGGQAVFANTTSGSARHGRAGQSRPTSTPIDHLIVIFNENISFDHYFGTYPHATNTDGIKWHAKPDTPSVNALTPALLHHNPNQMNPQRLGPAEALTCDQDHSYDAEQKAFNGGLMNKFVEFTERHHCGSKQYDTPGLVMDYYDGNTVTAMWNYAQRFAMSDNNYGTNFGPSTPGAINLISGNTHGAVAIDKRNNRAVDLNHIASPNDRRVGTLISDPDPDPEYDDCGGDGRYHAFFKGRNIGNLLNEKHVTWGWFSGGFRPTKVESDGTRVCGAQHKNVGGVKITDYAPHHEPFQYYKSTSNPKHLPPTSVAAIGHDDQANHQYDLTDFYEALNAGKLPAVSFIKPRGFEKGHPGSSDPLDEQHFLVSIINKIQSSKAWSHTAIIIAYDDSDGWYDHAMGPIMNPSHDWQEDWLNGQGNCGEGRPMKNYQDRCGYGPRLPLVVISPYAKVNFVNHALTDQTSIIRFIENNWLDGERIGDGSFDHLAGSLDGFFDWRHPHTQPLLLNPCTGQISHGQDKQQHPRQCHWPKQRGGRDQ